MSLPVTGHVALVGAGPGAPDLITVRGRALLRQADVVLHDRLINPVLLREIKCSAVCVDVGKSPDRPSLAQEDINQLILSHARAGRFVLRLKGGDSFVYGRGYEELAACREAGIACEVVPGISSALAAAAAVRVPLTHRDTARSVAILTGHTREGGSLPNYDYGALAKMDTLVLLMAKRNAARLAAKLMERGLPSDTPAVAIADATLPTQHSLQTSLGAIGDELAQAGFAGPVTILIGRTAAFAQSEASSGSATPTARNASGDPHRPLRGLRIALTQAITSTSELRQKLLEAGAGIVDMPLLTIDYPTSANGSDELTHLLRRAHPQAGEDRKTPHPRACWLVFTSVHSVRGFVRKLEAVSLDVRSLFGWRLAAVGPGTARELAMHGLKVDLLAPRPNSAALAEALVERFDQIGARGAASQRLLVLVQAENGRPELRQRLAQAGTRGGMELILLPSYRVVPAEPLPTARAALLSGVDVICFCSPSAVQQFGRSGLVAGQARVACIGATTRRAAAEIGIAVDWVADPAGSQGLFETICREADSSAIMPEACSKPARTPAS